MRYGKVKAVTVSRAPANEGGFILIAALTLLGTMALLGTTAFLLSSTDIRIGSNFRNSQMALQVAMAGAERGRETLRVLNASSSDPGSYSDELAGRRGANGILDGYSASTDDVALASGTMNDVSYVVYLTNDAADGSSNTTDANGKVVITSVATGPNNARARVETVITFYSGLSSSPATVYSKGDVTGNGSSLTINGNDSCGVSGALAPIYTKDPAETELNGNPTLTGSPPEPQHGSLDIDIAGQIEQLKAGATTILYEDQNNETFGSSTNYVTVYSWPDDPAHPNSQGLKLNNVTGYGILLVKGDLTLGGGFTWHGIILATGSVTLNGGGGAGINIYGQVYSGTSTVTDVTVNGSNTISYHSCDVKKALSSQPMKVVNWKHSY